MRQLDLAFLMMTALVTSAPTWADQWTTVSPMPERKALLAGATGGDGRIYAIGGTSDDGPPVNSRAYAYDSVADSWAAAASLSSPRRNMAVAVDLSGMLYVFGGYDFSGPPFALTIVERYDSGMGTWQRMSAMPTGRQRPAAATAPDGRIYVMGGTDMNFQTVAVNEVYDPLTDQWCSAASMLSPRTGFAAAAGPDGRIYVFGGYTGNGYVDTGEVYDPSTDSWAPIAPMNEVRYNLASATDTNGLIYAIGGYNGYNEDRDASTVEVYDAVADVWTPVASVGSPRSGHAATLGPDGRIYVFGGNTPSVEAYTP